MGRDGSTAEDTFYAKIMPHSLSLCILCSRTIDRPGSRIFRPVRVRNASTVYACKHQSPGSRTRSEVEGEASRALMDPRGRIEFSASHSHWRWEFAPTASDWSEIWQASWQYYLKVKSSLWALIVIIRRVFIFGRYSCSETLPNRALEAVKLGPRFERPHSNSHHVPLIRMWLFSNKWIVWKPYSRKCKSWNYFKNWW